MSNRIKKLPEIRQNLDDAEAWLLEARSPLYRLANPPLRVIKQYVQEAKKLVDEAVVDLDGLIQDQAMLLKNGSFIGPTALCHECGEPDCCVDTEYEAAVADLRPLFGVPQDGPGWGEEPWWA